MSNALPVVKSEALAAIHGTMVAAEIEMQTDHYREFLKSRYRFRRFVLCPAKNSGWSGRLTWWDLIAAGALLYTAVLSPFQAGFLETAQAGSPWFVMDRCVDAVFLVDMCLQFFLAYQTVDSLGSPLWVEDLHKASAARRLRRVPNAPRSHATRARSGGLPRRSSSTI